MSQFAISRVPSFIINTHSYIHHLVVPAVGNLINHGMSGSRSE